MLACRARSGRARCPRSLCPPLPLVRVAVALSSSSSPHPPCLAAPGSVGIAQSYHAACRRPVPLCELWRARERSASSHLCALRRPRVVALAHSPPPASPARPGCAPRPLCSRAQHTPSRGTARRPTRPVSPRPSSPSSGASSPTRLLRSPSRPTARPRRPSPSRPRRARRATRTQRRRQRPRARRCVSLSLSRLLDCLRGGGLRSGMGRGWSVQCRRYSLGAATARSSRPSSRAGGTRAGSACGSGRVHTKLKPTRVSS